VLRQVGWMRGAATIGVITVATIACSTTVHVSSGQSQFKRVNYGQGWPFRANSVVVACKAATGHIPTLTMTLNGQAFQLNADGSTYPAVPTSDLIGSQTDLALFAQHARLAC